MNAKGVGEEILRRLRHADSVKVQTNRKTLDVVDAEYDRDEQSVCLVGKEGSTLCYPADVEKIEDPYPLQ